MRTDTDIVYDAAGNVVSTTNRDVPVVYKVLTRFEFLALFTDAEVDAALDLENSTLRVFWRRYKDAEGFRRDHPLTADGIAALVATNVISQERADAIMAGWPIT